MTLDGRPASIALAVDHDGILSVLVMGPNGEAYERATLTAELSMDIANQIFSHQPPASDD